MPCGKRFKCTIFQPFGGSCSCPSPSVSCGWGNFDPKDEDLSNIIEKTARLADKALVEEMRDQIAKELSLYYSPSTTLDVEKVYEQEKEGADRIFYKIHPHGYCSPNPMYFTVEVPDYTREGKIEVKKGWLGFQGKWFAFIIIIWFILYSSLWNICAMTQRLCSGYFLESRFEDNFLWLKRIVYETMLWYDN